MLNHDPYRPVKLVLPLAGSIVIGGSIAQLPPTHLNDGLRLGLGTVALVGVAKTWCDATLEEQQQAQIEADDAVRSSVIESEARCNAAYYRRHPQAYRANKPVPQEWVDLWAATSGQPHLALHNLQQLPPATTQPIAQPQPQRHEMGVRGGSFDPQDGFAPQHPQAPIAPPTFSEPIATSAPIAYQPDLFDWGNFQQYPDRFPHICCVGASGTGKTTLQEWIARMLAGGNELVLLTTKRKSDQWVGLNPIGLGRNFPPVAQKWRELETELNQRCLDLDAAQAKHQVIICVDELNDLIAGAKISIANLARAGREPRLRLVVNSHTAGVDGLGLRGMQELKACFTWVRLGSFALQHAQTLANKGLLNQADLEWLKSQQRPCMVDDSLAQVPTLGTGWQQRLYGASSAPPAPQPENPAPPTITSFESDFSTPVQGEVQPAHPPAPAQIEPSAAPAPESDREAELLDKFGKCKSAGMNKSQTILALFGLTKGGNANYKMASEFYERLAIKYQEISGDSAA